MKFGRLLRTTAEDLPEMQSLFVSYKQLKKQLKRLPVREQLEGSQAEGAMAQALTEEENRFVSTLVDNLQHMNQRFMDKEENCIIRVEHLERELAGASTPDQLGALHKQFVDFHGEVLLLLHWSILAYTATVKILKKHHKRTGLLVRAPQLGDLLSQPFCSTELMTSIAHRVEQDISGLAARLGWAPPCTDAEAAAGGAAAAAAAVAAGSTAAADAHQAAGGAGSAGAAAPGGVGPGQAPSCQSNTVAGVDLDLLRRLANDALSGSSGDTSASGAARSVGEVTSSDAHKRKADGAGELGGAVSAPTAELVEGECSGAAAASRPSKQARLVAADGSGPLGCAPSAAAGPVSAAPSGGASGVDHQQQQEACPSDRHAEQPEVHAAGNAPAPTSVNPTVGTGDDKVAQCPLAEEGLTDGAAEHPAVPEAAADAAAAAAAAAGGSGSATPDEGALPGEGAARQGSILRQTQVALTTWAHLHSSASTPSTVLPGRAPAQRPAGTAITESSVA